MCFTIFLVQLFFFKYLLNIFFKILKVFSKAYQKNFQTFKGKKNHILYSKLDGNSSNY